MKKLHQLALALALVGFGAIPASAGTFLINSGGLTLTGIVDPTFNFAGLDFRGTVGLTTPNGAVVLTDTFANPTFGNTTLVAIDPVFDGTGAQVDFQLPTFQLLGGGAIFTVQSTGTTLVAPLSAPVSDMLQPLLFTFNLSSVQAIPGTPNFQAIYLLGQVDTVNGSGSAPEPATIGFGSLALGIAWISAKRRSRKVV